MLYILGYLFIGLTVYGAYESSTDEPSRESPALVLFWPVFIPIILGVAIGNKLKEWL